MKEYYTYAYLREDGTPYYIGKGTGNRAYKDDSRCCSRPPKNRIIILKDNLTENQAYKHEVYMIFHYGKKSNGGILRNQNDGGELTPNHKGKRFWTNGISNKMSFDCPGKSWKLGRISRAFPPNQKGMLWWNNGQINKKSVECPGKEWSRGMNAKKEFTGKGGETWTWEETSEVTEALKQLHDRVRLANLKAQDDQLNYDTGGK